MVHREYQPKEKSTTEITTWLKSNNKWWTFKKKLKNLKTKLKLSTKNNNCITSLKKDFKVWPLKSEVSKDNWLITIWPSINSGSIPGLKMSKSPTNMSKIKMISWSLSSMKSFCKEKKFKRKPKFFKTNWQASTNKCKWDSINSIRIKEASIKDSWAKTMILWRSTAKNKTKCKIC